MRALGGKGVLSDAFLGSFNCASTPALPSAELELALHCAYGRVTSHAALADADVAFAANCGSTLCCVHC